jgi:hypothetical protein
MDPKRVDRDKLLTRWGALQSERASWRSHWQELSDYILPRSGRFFVQDRNKGERRHNLIYDNTGTRALRVLGAGLMAGATSPARRWFKLRTGDPGLNEFGAVKIWLDDVTRLMETIFQKSNTYRALHTVYEELGTFGTGVTIVMPDFENVIHHHVLTCGEYAIATDAKGDVTTLYREFEMTVAAMVKEFGIDNVSRGVKHMFEQGTLDSWVTVIHAIEPRADRDASKKDAKNMPWKSCYFETGADPEKYLRESGFAYFPALCPRWGVAGGDIYGNSPAMEALGDIKQLQHEQLRKAQAIDYQTKPPLQVPMSLKGRDVDTLPGGVTFFDGASAQAGIRSLYEVRLDLNHLLQDMQDCRQRITGAFYADLFLMLANATDTRMTATEVAERHEEKLLMLGPVLERLHTELLSPLIETTFQRMVAAQILPPPPEELKGVEIDVEFVSMLAQAQRAVGANTTDRFMGNVGAIAQYKPEVLDKINVDYWADSYSDVLGVDPRLIVPTEVAMQSRQAKAQAAQAAEQAELAEKASKTVSNLNGVTQNNPLNDLMSQFSGYGSPAPQEI